MSLQLNKVPLDPETLSKLNKWLQLPESKIYQQILASNAAYHEVEIGRSFDGSDIHSGLIQDIRQRDAFQNAKEVFNTVKREVEDSLGPKELDRNTLFGLNIEVLP